MTPEMASRLIAAYEESSGRKQTQNPEEDRTGWLTSFSTELENAQRLCAQLLRSATSLPDERLLSLSDSLFRLSIRLSALPTLGQKTARGGGRW